MIAFYLTYASGTKNLFNLKRRLQNRTDINSDGQVLRVLTPVGQQETGLY